MTDSDAFEEGIDTLGIGQNRDSSPSDYFVGNLDEARLFIGELSYDWINATYENIHNPFLYTTIAAEQANITEEGEEGAGTFERFESYEHFITSQISSDGSTPRLYLKNYTTMYVLIAIDSMDNLSIFSITPGGELEYMSQLDYAAGGTISPNTLIDLQNGTLAAYYAYNAGSKKGYMKFSYDDGYTWTDRISTVDGTYNTQESRVPGSDVIHMVYLLDGSTSTYYKNSTDNGTTWSTAIVIDNNGKAVGDPRIIALSSSIIMTAVEENQAGGSDIIVKRSTDGGKTWAADYVLFGSGNTNDHEPGSFIDMGSGTVIYVVSKDDGTGCCDANVMKMKISTDWGATWGDEIFVKTLPEYNGHTGGIEIGGVNNSGELYFMYSTYGFDPRYVIQIWNGTINNGSANWIERTDGGSIDYSAARSQCGLYSLKIDQTSGATSNEYYQSFDEEISQPYNVSFYYYDDNDQTDYGTLYLDATDSLEIGVNSGQSNGYYSYNDGSWHTSSIARVSNDWVHVVISVASNTANIYIDNELIGSPTLTGNLTELALKGSSSYISDFYIDHLFIANDGIPEPSCSEPSLTITHDYNSTAYETTTQTFSMTIMVYEDVNIMTGNLIYDGINYGSGTFTETTVIPGNWYNFTLTKAITVPLIQTNVTEKQFYWNYTLIYDGGGTVNNLTENETQTLIYAYEPGTNSINSNQLIEAQDLTVTNTPTDNAGQATLNMVIWLNDTAFSMTESSGAFTGTANTSMVTTGYNYSVDFNTSLTITYNGDFRIMNTTTASITVFKIALTNCTAPSTEKTLHFYIKNEDTGAALIADLDITFDVWKTGEIVRDYSFEFTGQNNYTVCIYPAWEEYNVDSMAQYYTSGYSTRHYHLEDAAISNISASVNLYLKDNTTTDLITLRVLNSLGLPEEGVLINIARYNIGTNTYSTIAIPKTNFDGYAYSYLTKNTVWYRFTLYDGGDMLIQYDPIIIVDDSLTFQLSDITSGEWLDHYGQISGSCTFPSNTTTCTLTDTSGLMQSATLIVKRWTSLGYIDVCEESGTSSSLTLVCDLGEISGRIFYYEFSAEFENTHEIIESGYYDNRSMGPQYGDLGLIAALMLIMVFAMFGAWRWEIGIAGAGVAMGVSYSMGLILMSWGSVITIFVIIAITLYKGRTT